MTLGRVMMTVGGLTGLSRVAGFIRDLLTAAFLGAGPVADAFFVALKLPNFFRRISAEGAFSVAFVPLYTQTLEQEGDKEAGKFAGNVFLIMLGALSLFTLAAIAGMPVVIRLIAPGFVDDSLRYASAVELSRITFPYLLLMSLAALLGGMMNAHDKFAPFAFAPVLFNLCLIAAILIGAYLDREIGYMMAWGLFISGILQLLWLLACLRRYRIKLTLKGALLRRAPAERRHSAAKVKKLFYLMGPGVVGAGVMHINLFADMIIASLLPAGSVSYLYYADRLNQLPLGMVGIAVGTALLPMLTKALAAGSEKNAALLFNRALEYCLLLALPAATALFVIPETIIGALFGRGEFTASDAQTTSMVLRGYAIGLPAYIFVKVYSTVYWSRQDTMTPVKISIFVTAINIALSLTLIGPFGIAGISFATGLVGWLQVLLLRSGLKRYLAGTLDARFKKAVPKIVFCSILMAVFLLIARTLLAGVAQTSVLWQLLACFVGGGALYGGCILKSGAINKEEAGRYMPARLRRLLNL